MRVNGVNIRQAKIDDKEAIREFINVHWKKNHVLFLSEEIFDFFYLNGQSLNFVLGEVENRLIGILGFIPDYQFDRDLMDSACGVWLALWKVLEDVKYFGTGYNLLRYLTKFKNWSCISVSGINEKHLGLYKKLGFEIDILEHLFLERTDLVCQNLVNAESSTLRMVELTENLGARHRFLAKFRFDRSFLYYKNRFSKCSFYDYRIFGLKNSEHDILGLVVVKLIRYEGKVILRIIDYSGDQDIFSYCRFIPSVFYKSFKIDNIDILISSRHSNMLKSRLFKIVGCEVESFIPVYLEPVVEKKVSIYCATKLNNKDLIDIVMKGDGDQERPNLMHEN